MTRPNPRARPRNGAVPEVELDGSVTLYGLEDWTQIRDDPLVGDERRAGSGTPRRAVDDDVGTDSPGPDPEGDTVLCRARVGPGSACPVRSRRRRRPLVQPVQPLPVLPARQAPHLRAVLRRHRRPFG